MGIPGHLVCLLRNLYAGQEATVRTRHGTTDWFKIGKGVCQSCILSPCLFNFYVKYIVRNAGLDEAQAGIKIVGRNINNLRYADDNHPYDWKGRGTKEPLDEGERGEWKRWLKTQKIKKMRIMASGPITSWQTDGKQWKQWQTLLFWAPRSLGMVTAVMKLKDACSLEEKLWPT